MLRAIACILSGIAMVGCSNMRSFSNANAPVGCYTESGYMDSSYGCSAQAGYPDCYLVCPDQRTRKHL
jgi:hypothetical protein